MSSPIVLLSDFGTRDGYAAVMRGTIVSHSPAIRIHDGPHDITAFSITSAAYVLHTLLLAFPPGTIFVLVVDPGVGGARRELIAEIDGRIVVAPDNGAVTLAAHLAERSRYFRAADDVLAELAHRRSPGSVTFDGRDLFAPLGARIATGGVRSVCGAEVTPVFVDTLRPVRADDPTGTYAGTVIHVDHFGNAITNILLPVVERGVFRVRVGDRPIEVPLHTTFADVASGSPLAYRGSYGFLEFAVRNASAGTDLGITLGDPVRLFGGQTESEPL